MKNVRQTQCYQIENSVSSKIKMFDNFFKNIIFNKKKRRTLKKRVKRYNKKKN